jgi:hypothetical protein
VSITGTLHQAHIAFCRQREMSVRFADVAPSSTEPIALLGDENRHLRARGEYLLQMADLITRAMQDHQYDCRQISRQRSKEDLDVPQTLAAGRPDCHHKWGKFLFVPCCRLRHLASLPPNQSGLKALQCAPVAIARPDRATTISNPPSCGTSASRKSRSVAKSPVIEAFLREASARDLEFGGAPANDRRSHARSDHLSSAPFWMIVPTQASARLVELLKLLKVWMPSEPRR